MRNAVITWNHVAAYLQQQPTHSSVGVMKWQVEHPQAAGLQRSLGLPVGQLADWRMPSCRNGLHVREYVDRYTAHVDSVNPHCDLPGHLAADAPLVVGAAAIGALVGLALGESPAAMLVGALLGGAVGAAAAGATEAARCTPPKPRRA